MIPKRFLDSLQIDSKYLDPNSWPLVDRTLLSEKNLEIFNKRAKAVELYIQGEKTNNEIFELTSINSKELLKHVKNCFMYDEPTKTILGYRALIPYKRLQNYSRKAATHQKDIIDPEIKLTGAFEHLLSEYPEIRKKIVDAYLQRKTKSSNVPSLNGDGIHKYFLKLCNDAGINIHQYPFNTEDKARRSLYRFFTKIDHNFFLKSSSKYGKEASRQARLNTEMNEEKLLLNRPYQRVQFDGHKIDAMFTVSFLTPEGDTVTQVCHRAWLLVIVDVATRAVIGHHISINKEYNSDDVLHCIRNAVIPYKKIDFTIPDLDYHPEGGIPSNMIPQAEWALWDEFSYDNGKANLAKIVTDRLYQIVGCTLNPGPVSLPESRGIIERLFKSLEIQGYRKLPSTTGSHPNDPIRKNPQDKALQYEISIEHLEQLTHVLISNYNGSPHSGISNFSPLKLMQQRIERGLEPRILDLNKRQEAVFFCIQAKAKINGNIKKGKRPYIQYMGVIYRSEVLSQSTHLIGVSLKILINVEDLRNIRVFLPDGSEFGYVRAGGQWGIIPHSLRLRKAINKLKNERVIYFGRHDDPFQIYYAYLSKKAIKRPKGATKLAQVQRELKNLAKEKKAELNESSIQEIPNQKHTTPLPIMDSEFKSSKKTFRTYNI